MPPQPAIIGYGNTFYPPCYIYEVFTRSVHISLPFSAIMEYTFYLTLGGITQLLQTGLVQIPTIILVGIRDKVRCLFAFLKEKDILLLVVAQAIVR